MACTIRNWALGCTALLALAGAAYAGQHAAINHRTGLYDLPLSNLRKADEREDRVELARVAARLGPARVGEALQDRDRRIVLAALDAVPLLTSGVLLLDGVLPLLTSTDEAIRGRAVGAAAALLATTDAVRLASFEVPEETTQAICQALARVAANESETLSTRLLAVQGLADAPVACAVARKAEDLAASLLASREPEIRRAAVLVLLPMTAPASALLAATRDPDGEVAAAAGARLCERRATNPPLAAEPPLRKLALASGALPEDVIGILPCLANSPDPADHKALDDLQDTGPAAVRKAIRGRRRVDSPP